MNGNVQYIRQAWLDMLEPPWRGSTQDPSRSAQHWATWLIGWVWTLAGMLLGAVASPSLVQFAHLSGTPFQDPFIIAIAALAGFLIQLLGWWALISMLRTVWASIEARGKVKGLSQRDIDPDKEIRQMLRDLRLIVQTAFLPLLVVGTALYYYLTGIGAAQGLATIAFVGALLIKTFAIPLIKGIVTGALFRWFMRWLRGGKDTKKAG